MAACLQVTLASDVYSFGVIMWCLYTGQRPFVVKAGEWLPNKQFPKFPPGTPAQYSALVQRCLQWDPHKRPTFPEVSAILTAFFNEVLGPGGPHASVGQVARTPLPMPAPTTLSVGGMQAGITGAPASSDSSAFTMVTDGSVAENWREDGMLAERFLASRSLTVASHHPSPPPLHHASITGHLINSSSSTPGIKAWFRGPRRRACPCRGSTHDCVRGPEAHTGQSLQGGRKGCALAMWSHAMWSVQGHAMWSVWGHAMGSVWGHAMWSVWGHATWSVWGHAMGSVWGHAMGSVWGHVMGSVWGHAMGSVWGHAMGCGWGVGSCHGVWGHAMGCGVVWGHAHTCFSLSAPTC